MHKMRSCTCYTTTISHHKITQLRTAVVNLVSVVDTVFEELNLDLLLLLLFLIPFSLFHSLSFLLSNTAIPFNENKKQQ